MKRLLLLLVLLLLPGYSYRTQFHLLSEYARTYIHLTTIVCVYVYLWVR